LLVMALNISAIGLVACTSAPTSTPAPTPTPTANAVTIDLVAKNIAFDKSTITVPAGAQVTINFDNQDSGIPHNFAVYTNASASTSIFVGQIITGPKTITYTFVAPATQGTYFFRCDVHPKAMTGTFIVQWEIGAKTSEFIIRITSSVAVLLDLALIPKVGGCTVPGTNPCEVTHYVRDWPALIDKNVFDMIQKNMTERSPKVAHPWMVPGTYILSSLLFCSCGRAMIGHSVKSGRYFYYLCSRNFKQGKEACNVWSISRQLLEQMVIDHIRQRILTERNMEKLVKLVNQEIIASYSGLRDKINCIDIEIREVKGKLSRHYEAL
jgi:plastocyanin